MASTTVVDAVSQGPAVKRLRSSHTKLPRPFFTASNITQNEAPKTGARNQLLTYSRSTDWRSSYKALSPRHCLRVHTSVIGQASRCYRHHFPPLALPPLLSQPSLLPLQGLLLHAGGASSWLLWSMLLDVRAALVPTICIFARQTSGFARPCLASAPAVLDLLLPCEPLARRTFIHRPKASTRDDQLVKN